MSADEIIRTLKTKFWSLKYQGLCSPSEGNKLYTEGELDGLKLAMNNLLESKNRGGNGQYQDAKAQDLSRINYFRY